MENQTQAHARDASAHLRILGLDLCLVLDLIHLGVTLTLILIHVSKLFHLVINGTLTTNSIVTTQTKIKKNDKEEDQTSIQGECQFRILKSRINEDEGLIKAAKKACKNQKVQDDINAMEESIRQGNMNPGIGSKFVGEGIIEFRGRNGGRILARQAENGVVEILGKSGKKAKNQQYVINQAKKVFPKNQK